MRKMQRILVALLSILLIAGLVSGCAQEQQKQEAAEAVSATEETAKEPAETPTEESAEEPAKETEEEPAEIPAEEPAETPAEESAEEPAKETAEESVEKTEGTAEELIIPESALLSVGGDAAGGEIVDGGQEISGEEVEEMERVMRDYKPPKKSLVINNAKSFYYYDNLKKGEKPIYDALYTVAKDPANKECLVKCLTKYNPAKEKFLTKFQHAYISMIYDHPELFWLYKSDEYYYKWWYYKEPNSKGKYEVYFSLSKPLENYEARMKSFNDAVKSFLKAIDLTASDLDISWQIHDHLIDTVTYNKRVYYAKEESRHDLAHTAYGALVTDSQGVPRYAVCDGYSMAYVYLMQQAGLQAIFLEGYAGPPSNPEAHAWNMAYLGGKWYEVDATWDDFDGPDDVTTPDDQPLYYYVDEALHNTQYMELINHYLYAVNTERIRNWKTSEQYVYYSNDGQYWINLAQDSVHIRLSEYNDFPEYRDIIKRAPIAV